MDITVDHVSFAYERSGLVLDGTELTARRGELFALIGPNCSGKSTLLRVISSVIHPREGMVLLGDTPIATLSSRQIDRRLAVVEQDRQIRFDFTVREIVAIGRIAHRRRFAIESHHDRHAVERAMKLTDVGGLADRSLSVPSRGGGQRVYLATALAQEPKALLHDEPTTHLDLHHQVQSMSIVQQSASAGTAVLIATHDLMLAAQATDRIALISEGRIVVRGRPREVLTRLHIQQVFGVDVVVGNHPMPEITYILPMLPKRRPTGS